MRRALGPILLLLAASPIGGTDCSYRPAVIGWVD